MIINNIPLPRCYNSLKEIKYWQTLYFVYEFKIKSKFFLRGITAILSLLKKNCFVGKPN